MKALVNSVLVSLVFILVASVSSVIYVFFAERTFTLAFVFNWSFVAGVLIICAALVRMLIPARISFDKLTDHTTFGERMGERHAKKQKKAFGYLAVGISIIVITGLIQLVLAAVI